MNITKTWLKPHSPCADGYRWFLEKFPQGGPFGEVYAALRAERRYDDAEWLAECMFRDLGTEAIAAHVVSFAGADREKIKAQVIADGANPLATATTGNRANAATTGEAANAATTGYAANAAALGKNSVAACVGFNGMAKAGENGMIVIAYLDKAADRPRVKVGYVGEDGIKEGVWYRVAGGNLVEVAE